MNDTRKRGTFVLKLSTEVVNARKWTDLAKRTGKPVLLWDGGIDRVKGFGVKITPAGRKAFLFQYWSPEQPGVRRRVTKRFEGKTPHQARELAQKYRSDVTEQRIDPFIVEQQQLDQRIAEHEQTVAKLVERYLADVGGKLTRRTLYERSRMLRKHVVATFGDRPITSITRADVKQLHKAIGSHTTANRTVEALRAVMYWAADEGCAISPRELFTNYGGKRGWKHREEQSERFLSMDEYRTLGEVLTRAEREGLPVPKRLQLTPEQKAKRAPQKRGPYKIKKPRELAKADPGSIAAIRFAALSGWREGEVLSLRWDAIDWTRAQATLRDTKTGKSHRQLGRAALDVLATVRETMRVDGSPFVFPGAKDGEHLKELKRPWYAALDAAKLSLRFHDLRHSFASVAADRGYSELVIGIMLGHRKRSATTATSRYTHLSDEVTRRAADDVSSAIWAAMQGEQGAKVLPLRAKA